MNSADILGTLFQGVVCSNLSRVTKIGEGTFGEAFKEGDTVLKIVPVDGDFRVNGELQKVCTDAFVLKFLRLSPTYC